MKKLFIFAAVAALSAGLVFVACKKEETHIVKNNLPQTNLSKQQKLNGEGEANPWGPNWQIPDDPQTEDCIRIPATCYDEIIVSADKAELYDRFIQKVTSGSDSVADCFSYNHYRTIMPELSSEVLNELTSGNCYMHYIVNENSGKECLLVSHSSTYIPTENSILWMFRFIVER